jgi:GDPmannose 4,6-dehydratase
MSPSIMIFTSSTKALGWKPKTTFAELVKIMMEGDMELARREQRAGGPAAGVNGSGG